MCSMKGEPQKGAVILDGTAGDKGACCLLQCDQEDNGVCSGLKLV